MSVDQLRTAIRNSILNYKTQNLDQFDSKFILSRLQDAIDNTDPNSIIGSQTVIRLQKRFKPSLNSNKSYSIFFGAPLHRGTITNKMTSTQFKVYDSRGVEREVIFEETPQSYTGISSIAVLNGGVGYTSIPTVTILGDGYGAEATATIVNGKIKAINITKPGIEYTRATVSITGGNGYGAQAAASVEARTGTLRVVYFDQNAERQIIDDAAGTINYDAGIIDIKNILINSVSSTDGIIRLTIESDKGIIGTAKNVIITLDEDDATSISTILETV